MILNGGISINQYKVVNAQDKMPSLISDEYLIIQKGKKNYFLIKAI